MGSVVPLVSSACGSSLRAAVAAEALPAAASFVAAGATHWGAVLESSQTVWLDGDARGGRTAGGRDRAAAAFSALDTRGFRKLALTPTGTLALSCAGRLYAVGAFVDGALGDGVAGGGSLQGLASFHRAAWDTAESRALFPDAVVEPDAVQPGETATPFAVAGGDLGDASAAVADVAGSRRFAACCTADGRVVTFGAGFAGELGRAHTSWDATPAAVTGALAGALAEGGGATRVAAGNDFALAATRTPGELVAWGRLAARGVGFARVTLPTSRPLERLAAGSRFAVATDGERVFVVGDPPAGADDRDTLRPLPRQEGVDVALAEVRLPPSTSGVVDVAAGPRAAGAVTTDGDAYCFGALGGRGADPVPLTRVDGLSHVLQLALGESVAVALARG